MTAITEGQARGRGRLAAAWGVERRGETLRQLSIYVALFALLVLTFVPIIYMFIVSLKDNGQVYARFWSLPNPIRWINFSMAARTIARPMLNSVLTTVTATAGTLLFASMSGYAFARHRFPGKEFLYTAILSLLMIPPILTLIPAYVLIANLGMTNTYWALILPWTSGGQVFALLLCRSFFATLPEEFFDAARIDGASEFQTFLRVAAPLSVPILVTVAVVRLVTTYNQFMWPLVVISSPARQVVAVALTQFTSELGITDIGPQMAAYIVAAVPLIVLFSLGMKQYVQGITAGGLKA
jgi:ABC-type glycerol-3-phosphate transport system permease component